MIEKVYIEYLIAKAQQDPTCVDELLQIIQPKVLNYCRRMISDAEWAKDAAQDSLIVIFSKLHKLKDHRRFHAWMYQVTHNKCMDIFRKRKPQLNQELDQNTELQLEYKEQNQDESIDMINVINTLPNKLKSIVTLFYYEGFSIKEIAGILETPAGTIKSDLFHAREHIKSIYGDIQ